MKIIDLLNKIANGEEVPNRIKLDNYEFQYNKTYEQYHNKYETNLLEHISDYNYSGLNDEVEILDEEDEFIDIEEFKSFITNVGAVNESNIEEYIHILFKQQTALINNQKKIINKLKEEDK